MSEQKKKSARGDVFLMLEGTVGTKPESNTIKTKNGDLDVCSFRCVASPYRPGQAEPEDMWFTVRVAGNQSAFASKLQVGDFISVRGGFAIREYDKKDGSKGIDYTVNADSSPNSLRRLSFKRDKTEEAEAAPEPVAVGAASADSESLFG